MPTKVQKILKIFIDFRATDRVYTVLIGKDLPHVAFVTVYWFRHNGHFFPI